MEVEGGAGGVQASLEDSNKDQVAWAQCLLEGSYFDSYFSPQSELQSGAGGFPDVGEFCHSPLLSEQLKTLHSWNSRVSKQADESVSTSISASESEPFLSTGDDKVRGSLTMGCGDGDGVKESRKRKARSEGEDEGSLLEKKSSSLKKIKVKCPKQNREPRYAIKTRSEVDIMEDGFKWRKYGQKPVKSSPHPRNYYRCTTANCPVRKRVERDTEDTTLVITSYEGTHSHPKVTQPKNPSGLNCSNHVHDCYSLLDPLGRPGATLASHLSPFSAVPNVSHLWGSSLTYPGWPKQQAPSVHDNVGLIMAYQLVKLQWELQARTQQLMRFNTQSAVAQDPAFSDPEVMKTYASCVDSDPHCGQQFPNPEPTMGSSLLRKRAGAFRNGGLFPLDLQNVGKMQQPRIAQFMTG